MTAEFAMMMPVVFMILAICLSSLALQLERMKLVSVAATISRAIARGESADKFTKLLDGRNLTFKNSAEYICAEVSSTLGMPALAGLAFAISDTECARSQGL